MTAVDVLIPTRSRPGLTARAIRSALAQTGAEVTVYVADDASESAAFAELENGFHDEPRVVLLRSEEQLGPAGARQMAFEAGAAEWVATLDSDDEWLPEKLQAQLGKARESGADVVICWFAWIRPDGSERIVRRPTGEGRVSPGLTNNIDVPLARRALVDAVGGFVGDEWTPRFCDEHLDFMIRLLSAAQVATVSQVLVHCHDHLSARASDGVSVQVESLGQVVAHRGHLFEGFPDDLAGLHARYSARLLAARHRREGVRQLLTAFQLAGWKTRLNLLREFGPFTVKQLVRVR